MRIRAGQVVMEEKKWTWSISRYSGLIHGTPAYPTEMGRCTIFTLSTSKKQLAVLSMRCRQRRPRLIISLVKALCEKQPALDISLFIRSVSRDTEVRVLTIVRVMSRSNLAGTERRRSLQTRNESVAWKHREARTASYSKKPVSVRPGLTRTTSVQNYV